MNGRTVIATSALSALLCCCGCGDEAETLQPVTATCLVQGKVGRIGASVDSRVYLRTYVPNVLDRLFEVEADDAGLYRAEVPAGDYVISAHVGWTDYWHTGTGGMTQRRADADTVRLGPENSPHTVDFPFGALRFQMEQPPLPDGSRVRFIAYEADSSASGEWIAFIEQVTIADGRLEMTMPGLRPGAYAVKIDWSLDRDHAGENFWLPDTRERAQAALYRVGPDSLTTVPLVFPSTPARLCGRVTGAWLAMGMAAPELRALAADGATVAGPWDVNEDGSFELLLFRPEPVRLEVRIDGIRQWVGGAQLSEATVFAPQAGQVIDGIDVVCGGLRLRILPSGLFAGEDRASFEFYDPAGPTLLFKSTRQLQYQMGFANLRPGDWLVRVVHYSSYDGIPQRWRPQWLDRRATAAIADILHVPDDGGVLTLDLVLEAGGVIGGRVVSATGGSTSRWVVVTPVDSPVIATDDYAGGPAGEFAVVGLADGSYRLGVTPPFEYWGGQGGQPPDSTIWYPGTTDWASAQAIVITDAGTVEGLVLDIP